MPQDDDRPPESTASVPGKYFGLVGSNQEYSQIIKEAFAHGPGAYWRHPKGCFYIIVPMHESWEQRPNKVGLPGRLLHDIYHCPHRRPNDGVCWDWNGEDEKATLKPSIYPEGIWHGYLTDGNLISV